MSTTPGFAHLHQHTAYSLLDGAARIKDLVNWVKKVSPDQPALAMTDHGNMHGAVEFYKTAVSEGVKPVLGLEAYIAAGSRFEKKRPSNEIDGGHFHLTLLAKNFEGYQNLCRLSSRAYLEGFYMKPRIDHELLEEHGSGIIALSGCLGAQLPRTLLDIGLDEGERLLEQYLAVFGEDFFIELQDHGLPEQRELNPILKDLANRHGLGMVATNDGHYVRKEDAKAHEALLAIQTKTTLSDPDRFRFPCEEFFVKTPEEMAKAVPEADYPSALSNTLEVVARCNVDLPIGSRRVYQMPEVNLPEGRTLAEELRITTYLGLMQRYPDVLTPSVFESYLRTGGIEPTEELDQNLLELARLGEDGRLANVEGKTYDQYQYPHLEKFEAKQANPGAFAKLARAEYELGVIIAMGFPDYFLIVADFINWAKDNRIAVGPGRGSGAGSIVAYALRITDIDPLEYDLLFERFLNPDRISLPDFDIDFSDTRRGEVIDYVRQKYGEDKVAHIATFGTMASKAAIRDAARVLEAPYSDADRVSKLVPVVFGRSVPIRQALDEVTELKNLYDTGANQYMDVAISLEGLTRHASVHAAGVIIAKEPIQELAPVFRAGDGPLVCQYDMGSVEELGFIKMDFLGLRTLSFIEATVKIVEETTGNIIDPDKFPMDDVDTFELLSRGDAVGVFQFESPGMIDTLRKLRPRRIQDLIAVSALYRPGPMENIPTYIRRHHGEEEVAYLDFPESKNLLAPILEETYGIPVYQEQIMQIAQAVAGYTLGQADILRRAMGKKKVSEMEEQRDVFRRGAESHGLPITEADRIFDLLEKFANYGFNKSHSAAYGLLSYQTAYLKAHYPLEFAAALLTVERANSEKIAQYVNDAKHLNVEVLPPDLNISGADFTPVDGLIRFGLYGIKNVGDLAVDHILSERATGGSFKDLYDFCSRTDSSIVNKRALEYLVKSGAFDNIGKRDELLANLEPALRWGTEQRAQANQGQFALFEIEDFKPPEVVPGDNLTLLDLLRMEKESLGLYISAHPMGSYVGLSEAATCSVAELEQQSSGDNTQGRSRLVLSGLLQNVTRRTTRKGTLMARFDIADQSGSHEIVAFSRTLEEYDELLEEDAPAVLVVDVSSDGDGLRIVLDRLYRWDNQKEFPQLALISFDSSELQETQLRTLRTELENNSGSIPITFRVTTEFGTFDYSLEGLGVNPRKLSSIVATLPSIRIVITADRERLIKARRGHRPKKRKKVGAING
jgi:DNA polymerase-3 subunit alpha